MQTSLDASAFLDGAEQLQWSVRMCLSALEVPTNRDTVARRVPQLAARPDMAALLTSSGTLFGSSLGSGPSKRFNATGEISLRRTGISERTAQTVWGEPPIGGHIDVRPARDRGVDGADRDALARYLAGRALSDTRPLHPLVDCPRGQLSPRRPWRAIRPMRMAPEGEPIGQSDPGRGSDRSRAGKRKPREPVLRPVPRLSTSGSPVGM